MLYTLVAALMQSQLGGKSYNSTEVPDALADTRIPKEHPTAHPQLMVK